MNRRRNSAAAVLSSILVFAFSSVAFSAPKKNIVVIMADDIAYDNNFGAYGARESWTPRLDQLAREGITFEHAYSTPKCTPSRVKLMTGRSGIRNYIGFGKLASTEVTFAHMLQQAGYRTHVAGKWQLDGKGGTATSDAGFDTWFLWNTELGRGSRYWEPNFDVNGMFEKAIASMPATNPAYQEETKNEAK